VKEVELRANNEEFKEAMIQKTSLLMYRIACGQHFHEGNKRTALVAGSAFLQMNGYSIDIKDGGLVSVIDKAGIATASLNDVYKVVKRLIRNVK
jgi:prophage maintenance system killer protein